MNGTAGRRPLDGKVALPTGAVGRDGLAAALAPAGDGAAIVDRKGYCEEVGEAVRWLCQPSQSFITGMTIHVNGGEYMP